MSFLESTCHITKIKEVEMFIISTDYLIENIIKFNFSQIYKVIINSYAYYEEIQMRKKRDFELYIK